MKYPLVYGGFNVKADTVEEARRRAYRFFMDRPKLLKELDAAGIEFGGFPNTEALYPEGD